MDTDQAQQKVWPDLSPHSLERLSAKYTSRQRVYIVIQFYIKSFQKFMLW